MKNSGIYAIENRDNGKYYIGSSSNLKKRKRTHFRDLENNKHHSRYLQRAYNKYGPENFEFIVLFNCKPEDCLEFENNFIKELLPEYNTSKDAISPMKGRKHSKSTLEKFKQRQVKSGAEHYTHGKSTSEETKKKQSIAHSGHKHSEETKQKMRETAIRINAIGRVNRDKAKRKVIDNDGVIYESLAEAAKRNNIHVATVCDILKGRCKQTRKKKSFKYYE